LESRPLQRVVSTRLSPTAELALGLAALGAACAGGALGAERVNSGECG